MSTILEYYISLCSKLVNEKRDPEDEGGEG